MNRKIIEWSRRRIQVRAPTEFHVLRWYSALTPNRPSTVATYTEVPSAAEAPTVAAAREISVAPEATAPTSDQRWIQPRIRGLMEAVLRRAVKALVTTARLRDRRFCAVPRWR
ncbi:hypothetical protein GCM10020366_66940 [Saccharopolyspora gregorii]|uniref:Uncharacterized protein n=1 Tax=Saccharopolyspora gregorii TaxID=33914 RepID=A0ABP6S1T7_9PSEU